jgi:hypothetical protein
MSRITDTETVGARLSQQPAGVFKIFARGWNDAMQALPFPGYYDEAPAVWQLYYESGRLLAANVAAAGLSKVLIDRFDDTALRYIERLADRSVDRLGNPLPGIAA